jgi:hypothetical protein
VCVRERESSFMLENSACARHRDKDRNRVKGEQRRERERERHKDKEITDFYFLKTTF